MAPEGTDPTIFKKAYDSIYFEGRNLNNSTFDSMWEKFNVYEDIIPKDVARIIYQAAVDAKNSERNNAINKAMNPGAKPKGKVSGRMKNKNVDTFVRAVAAKFGADIVVTNSFKGKKNASFDPDTGKIYVRSDSKQITKDLVHEMMEAVIAYHTGAAFEIQDVVISFLTETKGTEFVEDWLENYRDAYEKEEGSKTTSEAKADLVNDHVGVLFSTEEGMKQFCDWILDTDSVTDTKKKDIIQSLKKMIDDVVDFFKRFLNFAKDNEVLVAAAQTDYETAKAIRKLVLDAFDKVSQTLARGNAEGDVKVNSSNVRYSFEVTTENGIIRKTYTQKDIDNNIISVSKMSSVKNISASKLEKTGKKPFDIFMEYFNDLGNQITTDEFGIVSLSKSSVKSEIRHGLTAEKIASIEAIPDILHNGKVVWIGYKGEGVERLIVAAPITIGDTPYYMGIMLQRDSRYQKLYLHNVIIEKETSIPSQGDLITTGTLTENENLFITTILQKVMAVKYQNRNSLEVTDHTVTQSMLEKLDENIVESKEQRNQRLAVVYHQCKALYIINTECCISSSRKITPAMMIYAEIDDIHTEA